VCIDKFTCIAQYCRKLLLKGGVCIYVNNNLTSSCLNLEVFCRDKIIEVCGVKFKFQGRDIYLLTVYRSPSGNFNNFINQLENIVHSLYNIKHDLIICGDMNVNYLEESGRVKQLNALLKTFNLVNVVTSPTRTFGHSSTSIDNVFIDITRFSNFIV
jgi:exonuclease III